MVHTKTETGHHGSMSSAAHENEGEHLEKQMWADMKALNMTAIEKKIAPEFQSIHLDGPRNRTQEISLIKNLSLGNFTLSNFKTTHQDETMIVTYTIFVAETIDERHLSTKPSLRMSVWKKDKNNQWQWLAHANLISLGKH